MGIQTALENTPCLYVLLLWSQCRWGQIKRINSNLIPYLSARSGICPLWEKRENVYRYAKQYHQLEPFVKDNAVLRDRSNVIYSCITPLTATSTITYIKLFRCRLKTRSTIIHISIKDNKVVNSQLMSSNVKSTISSLAWNPKKKRHLSVQLGSK